MNRKMIGIFGMAMAMMSDANMQSFKEEDKPKKFNPQPKRDIEPQPKNGQLHYWFREDGSFIKETDSERMQKDECVFKCFSINDKNAIKKFNQFNQTK